MNFLQGIGQGAAMGHNRDARKAQQQAFGAQQQLAAQKNAMAQTTMDQATADKQLASTVQFGTYLRTLPEQERVNALSTASVFGVDQATSQGLSEMIQANPTFLSDSTLDGFISTYGETQVLGDKDALIGPGGREVYSNRYNAPQVVSDGSALVGDDGSALYENAKDVAPQAAPTSVQEYQFAQQNPGFTNYQTQMKQAGRSAGVTVNTGESMTPGRKKMDELAGTEVYGWMSGGAADTAKQVNQLKNALGIVESDPSVTGRSLQGNLPDAMLAIFNPEMKEVRDQVAEVVQRNLKAVLGAQFTEKEGQALIARAFDSRLSKETQAQRLKNLVIQMEMSMAAKNQMSEYFRESGTLIGYDGETPSLADFEKAVSEGGGESSRPNAGKTLTYNPQTGGFD